MKNGKLKDIGALVLLLTVFFGFSIFSFSTDAGDVGLASFSNSMVLAKAHEKGEGFLQAINVFEPGFQRSYTQDTFSYPLSAALLLFAHLVFGVSVYSPVVLCLFFGAGAVIFCYFLGKAVYNDRLYGLVLSLLIASDVYFNVNIKTGALIFAINIFLISATLYFFIKAHLKDTLRRYAFILLSSFFLSLCVFNGYPQPYSVFFFLGIFFVLVIVKYLLERLKVVAEGYSNIKLLRIDYYLVFALAAALLISAHLFSWDLYNKMPLGTTYRETMMQNIGSYAPDVPRFKIDDVEFNARTKKFFESVFVDIDSESYFSSGGVHSDTAFSGQPVLPYLCTFFFIFGIYFALKKRRPGDILVLSFLGATFFIIFFIFKPYAPRIYIFSTLFLMMASATVYVALVVSPMRKLFGARFRLVAAFCSDFSFRDKLEEFLHF